LLVGFGLVAAQGVASGQTQEFSVQRFEPAPGPNNSLTVETLHMDGGWSWSAGLFMNYSLDPYVVQSCRSLTTCSDPAAVKLPNTDVVRDMLTWDLLASISPRPWVQIGLRVPLSYVDGDGLNLTTGGPLTPSLQAFSIGDPDIEAKFRLWSGSRIPLSLGVAGDISFVAHSTSATNFIGDSSPVTGGVRAILDGSAGRFVYAANLRAIFREDVTVGMNQGVANTTLGPEFRYGAAAGFKVTRRFEILAEGFGGTGFSSSPGTNSLEIDGALRFLLHDSDVALTAGGGGGVVQGVGVPAARAFLGIMYARSVHDRDGDGVPDNVDRCPDVPAPKDDSWDGSGCPHVKDADGDGIPDDLDKCPDAGGADVIRDPKSPHYGCPEALLDRDHDGIPDKLDKCPDAGGPDVIRNPDNPYYGCPDRDHDGTPDYLDKCPDQPEATDDLFDGSGCPHVRDTDGDGIPDDVDQCPTEPETYNGYKDEDGCPDTGPAAVEVTETGITIHDRIEFAVGRDKINTTKSFQVLNAVAGVLHGHKEILVLEVQGHTDSAGAAEANRVLSQKRAEAVVKYLVSKGVEPGRLKAVGYGPDHPIAFNTTAAGRQKNRRVEFHILESRNKKADASVPPPVTTPPAVAPPRAAPAVTAPPAVAPPPAAQPSRPPAATNRAVPAAPAPAPAAPAPPPKH
jgi:outer membrane protein OmpA-like peptidoglycan-associated protein